MWTHLDTPNLKNNYRGKEQTTFGLWVCAKTTMNKYKKDQQPVFLQYNVQVG